MVYKLQAVLLLQYSMCSIHVSWLSIIIHKYCVDSFSSISVPSMYNVMLVCFDLANKIKLLFEMLRASLFVLNQSLIISTSLLTFLLLYANLYQIHRLMYHRQTK